MYLFQSFGLSQFKANLNINSSRKLRMQIRSSGNAIKEI